MSNLKPGDCVRYYSLMNPRSDLKGAAEVIAVRPMYEGGENMIWLKGVRGAWHPDAVEPLTEALEKSSSSEGSEE